MASWAFQKNEKFAASAGDFGPPRLFPKPALARNRGQDGAPKGSTGSSHTATRTRWDISFQSATRRNHPWSARPVRGSRDQESCGSARRYRHEVMRNEFLEVAGRLGARVHGPAVNCLRIRQHHDHLASRQARKLPRWSAAHEFRGSTVPHQSSNRVTRTPPDNADPYPWNNSAAGRRTRPIHRFALQISGERCRVDFDVLHRC